MSNRFLWLGAITMTMVLAVCLLAACTGSISGGIAGIVGTLTLLGLLFGISATQSGCDDSVGACLRIPIDSQVSDTQGCLSVDGAIFDGQSPEVGPCLQPPLDVGACLQPPLDVGACLQPPLDVGTCLQPPLDVGPCLKIVPPDAGADTKVTPVWDAGVGPCLSVPPSDAGAALMPAPKDRTELFRQLDQQRASAIARLRDRLPVDVVAKLNPKRDEHSA